MEDKIELEIIGLSSSHAQSGSFALVLGEKDGKRRLPIIVGMYEAQSIAVEIEKIKPKRPLTHDLIKTIADDFKLKINYILITNLKEGVFYANLQMESESGQVINIDARPSDAIALCLRFNAPIFTIESVLSEAGIILEESHLDDDLEDEEPKTIKHSSNPYEHLSIKELEQLLSEAIDNEDYEVAAKIRDEIDKRN